MQVEYTVEKTKEALILKASVDGKVFTASAPMNTVGHLGETAGLVALWDEISLYVSGVFLKKQ